MFLACHLLYAVVCTAHRLFTSQGAHRLDGGGGHTCKRRGLNACAPSPKETQTFAISASNAGIHEQAGQIDSVHVSSVCTPLAPQSHTGDKDIPSKDKAQLSRISDKHPCMC